MAEALWACSSGPSALQDRLGSPWLNGLAAGGIEQNGCWLAPHREAGVAVLVGGWCYGSCVRHPMASSLWTEGPLAFTSSGPLTWEIFDCTGPAGFSLPATAGTMLTFIPSLRAWPGDRESECPRF